jgi:hypothetical protein
VVERPAGRDRPSPVFTVGFVLPKEGASTAVKLWLASRSMFAQSGVKKATIDNIRGVYVPAYLYTAVSKAEYRAEIGENYQETETYTTTNAQGQVVVQTRTVTKTEYRTLQGEHASYINDVLVTASRGIGNDELEMIEPYDLRALRRYTPAMISGWIAEEPTMTLEECIQLARGEALGKLGAMLGAFMPGDSHKDLVYRTRLEHETADLVHVPVWVLAVRHDPQKPPIRVLVNGQSGKVLGKAPLSWIKITLTILAVLAVITTAILVISYLAEQDAPPRRGPSPPSQQPQQPARGKVR